MLFICLKNALMPSENQQVLRLRLAYLMRRFLFLALGMGLLLPTAANAESVWLLITESQHGDAMVKIEMEDLKQCEKMGYLWASKTNDLIENPQSYQWTLQGSWKCIIGK